MQGKLELKEKEVENLSRKLVKVKDLAAKLEEELHSKTTSLVGR